MRGKSVGKGPLLATPASSSSVPSNQRQNALTKTTILPTSYKKHGLVRTKSKHQEKRGVKRSMAATAAEKFREENDETRKPKKLRLSRTENGEWRNISSADDKTSAKSSTVETATSSNMSCHTNPSHLQNGSQSPVEDATTSQKTENDDGKVPEARAVNNVAGSGTVEGTTTSVVVQEKKLQSAVVAVEKRKRKRVRRKRQMDIKNINHINPKSFPKIKAYLKREWLGLKMHYRREQRKAMGNLKSMMRTTTDISGSTHKASGFIKHHIALNVKSDSDDEFDVAEPPVPYLDPITDPSDAGVQANTSANIVMSDDEDMPGTSGNTNATMVNVGASTSKAGCSSSSKKSYSFVPNVLIEVFHKWGPKLKSMDSNKFNWTEQTPLPRFEELKRRFSQYGEVCYVDVDESHSRAVIRFQDARSAQKAIQDEDQYRVELLTGIKEERYWETLLDKRENKRDRDVKKIRGRQEIVRRANKLIDQTSKKHIKFSCDFPC